LGNPKKSFFNSIIHTSHYLHYFKAKQTVASLPTGPPHMKNITALPCEMENFFI